MSMEDELRRQGQKDIPLYLLYKAIEAELSNTGGDPFEALGIYRKNGLKICSGECGNVGDAISNSTMDPALADLEDG